MPSRRIIFLLAAAFCTAGGLVPEANGEDRALDPLHHRHLSPLVIPFGLPPAESGQLVPAGRIEGRLLLEGANNFSIDRAERERLTLDGETYRVTVAFRLGISDRVELGIDVPYLAHEEGIFDGFIEDFHQTFGLLNNSREDFPHDELSYRYAREGRTRFAHEEPVSGIGDLLLNGAFRLWGRREPAPRALALRTTLKLPTGDAGKLTGSGGTDCSLALAFTDGASLAGWRMTLYGMGGGMYLGESDLLDGLQRRWAAFATFGFGWQATDWVAFKLQVDGHTAFFKDSSFRPLDSWATQLVGGFTFDLPADMALDLALAENIFVETAPDVALHLALKKLF